MDLIPGVVTVAGHLEIDHSIATLVLAFATDPVARWMYADPHQYLLHMPRVFKALGTNSFRERTAQRTGDGMAVALWLPPGVHSDARSVEVILAESIADERQAEVGALFEQTEQYRPAGPHWYLSLIGVDARCRNRGYGETLLQHGLRRCDEEHLPAYLWSSNSQNISFYERNDFIVVGTIQTGSSPSIFPMLRHAR